MSLSNDIHIIPKETPKIKIIVNNEKEKKEDDGEKKETKIKNIDKTDFEYLVNYVNEFINNNFIITDNREDRIHIKDLFDIFSIWIKNKTKLKFNTYTFGRAIKKNNIKNIHIREGTYYIGIKLQI